MRNRFLLCFLIIPILSFAQYASDIQTVYKDGTFTTTATIDVDCNAKVAVGTVNAFIAQFVGDPNQLFQWALDRKSVG